MLTWFTEQWAHRVLVDWRLCSTSQGHEHKRILYLAKVRGVCQSPVSRGMSALYSNAVYSTNCFSVQGIFIKSVSDFQSWFSKRWIDSCFYLQFLPSSQFHSRDLIFLINTTKTKTTGVWIFRRRKRLQKLESLETNFLWWTEQGSCSRNLVLSTDLTHGFTPSQIPR